MKRALIPAVLCFPACLLFAPASGFADAGNQAKIGETEYATLDDALAAARDGDTSLYVNGGMFTGSGEVTVESSWISSPNSLTINGGTITSKGDDANPQTSDETSLVFFLVLMMLSGIVCMGATVAMRKPR